jgi:hypothetical protein
MVDNQSMIRRIQTWWAGRPYHKIKLVAEDTGKHLDTLRFSDEEWAMMLLAMGTMGCRTLDEALERALQIAVEHGGVMFAPQPEPEDEFRPGTYL